MTTRKKPTLRERFKGWLTTDAEGRDTDILDSDSAERLADELTSIAREDGLRPGDKLPNGSTILANGRSDIGVVPPEYRGERAIGRGRNTPDMAVADMMDRARAEGVKPRAKAGGAQGAKSGGTVRTPQRPPAGGQRQRDGQRRPEATPKGVYRLFREGLCYRDISGRLGITEREVRVLYDEHKESTRTFADKVRSVKHGDFPRFFPWSEVRAALTTASGVGGGTVGTVASGNLGFLRDMAPVLMYLGVDEVRAGESKQYWGETLPETGWVVEGGELTNTAAPTLGTMSVLPKNVFGRYDVTSSLMHLGEPGFLGWLQDSMADLLDEQLVAALFDGALASNQIQGFLRKTGFPTVYYGDALTEANIRSCVSLLRTNKGVGTMPVWLLSEGYRNAAVAGGWASETGVHTGVMLPNDSGEGIHYVVSQHLRHPAGTDPAADPEIVNPAILCYGDSWKIPFWGLLVSQFMDPSMARTQYKMELLVNSVPLQAKSFVLTQGGTA